MNEKIISQVTNELRGSLPQQDAWLLALLLMVWAKLSSSDTISPNLKNLLNSDPMQIWDSLDTLAHAPGIIGQAFSAIKRPARKDIPGLRTAIDLCIKLSEAGMLDSMQPADLVMDMPSHMGVVALPTELADLMVGVIAITNGQSVYIPWDMGAQLASRCMKLGADVTIETPVQSPLAAIVGLLTDGNLSISHSDPVREPMQIENGKLRSFDISAAFPPVGYRYDLDVIERDWFNRFPERTPSATVLSVRHLLAQTHGRIVIAVPNSLLFSTGAEHAMRSDLVARGIVEAVVSLPNGLFSSMNVAISLLILDPRGGRNEIRFVNGEAERYREPISKARSKLKNIDEILDMIAGRTTNEDVAIISTQAVLTNDAQLQVSRYVLGDTKKQVQAMIESAKTMALGDLFETIRPMPITQDEENSIEVWEIGAADLPPYGYISTPGRTLKVDKQIAAKNKHQFLRPHDIVLIIKGSVGKVGIVPDNIPEPGAGGWVIGQSATILRAQQPGPIDPRAVLVFLRSQLGQELLNSIVSGATIQLIQLRELVRLQVVIPPLEAAKKIAKAIEAEAEIQSEIDRLRLKQSQIAEEIWNLGADQAALDEGSNNFSVKLDWEE